MDFLLCTRLYTLYTHSDKQHRFGPAECKALALSHFPLDNIMANVLYKYKEIKAQREWKNCSRSHCLYVIDTVSLRLNSNLLITTLEQLTKVVLLSPT